MSELHPVAREVINAFAPQDYFRSHRFTATLAERDPLQYLLWTLNLLEPRVHHSNPPKIVAETLATCRSAFCSPSDNLLPLLNELTEQAWSTGAYDDSQPFLQRAVARLGRATMCFICETTGAQYTGTRIACGRNATLKEMSNQCAMAIDMTFTDTVNGRFMVASSFSTAMNSMS